MASKLSIYNDALTNFLGSRKLSALTENRPERHWLDSSWDADLVQSVMEDTDWNCMMTSGRSDHNTEIEPEYGYSYGHSEPSGIWRLSSVCEDEFYENPMEYWVYEGGVIYTERKIIYLRYILADKLDDIASWPSYFARHVAGELAMNAASSFKKTTDFEKIAMLAQARKSKAKSDDAQRGPTKRIPMNNWVRARAGGSRRYAPSDR